MTIPSPTAYPGDLPDISDPVTFNTRMTAYTAWFAAVVSELTGMVDGINLALDDDGTVLETAGEAIALARNATQITATTGSASAFSLVPPVPVAAYKDGQSFLVRLHLANGASPTLNVGGLGALPILIRNASNQLAAPEVALMAQFEEFIFTVSGNESHFEISSTPIKELRAALIDNNFASEAAARAATATSGLMSPLRTRETIEGVRSEIVIVQDQKAQGTPGGDFAQAGWRRRDLNEVVANGVSGASLAGDRVTLPAGTYRTTIFAPAFEVRSNKLRLWNETDGETIAWGRSEYNDAGSEATVWARLDAEITLAAAKVLEVQHYCTNTKTNGFGIANNFPGAPEIYTTAVFEKIG